MISPEHIPYIALTAAAMCFLAWTERRHAIETSRKDRLIADLMDRLMSRDVGEYTMARQERERPSRPVAPEHYATEEENIIGFQSMGEDWQKPDRWMKEYVNQIKEAGKGVGAIG